jgi:hypothetical protein
MKEGLAPLLDAPKVYPLKWGRNFERGHRRLSLKLPSPARLITGFKNVTGWRGAGGEVKISTFRY